MKCNYIGTRDRIYNEGNFSKRQRKRGAELWARYDNEEQYNDKKDCELFDRTIKLLKEKGWEITEGVPGWAFCEVRDREEYNEFFHDYKEAQKYARDCMKKN